MVVPYERKPAFTPSNKEALTLMTQSEEIADHVLSKRGTEENGKKEECEENNSGKQTKMEMTREKSARWLERRGRGVEGRREMSRREERKCGVDGRKEER